MTVLEKKVNYLNNKDMLKEIHKSKITYCEFTDPKYQDYDVIIYDATLLTSPLTVEEGKKNRAMRLALAAYEKALWTPDPTRTEKPKLSEFKIDPATIPLEDVVIRVMTYDHIPESPGRKKSIKNEGDKYHKLNFKPFKHYILTDDNGNIVPKEVGKSHFKGGKFSTTHGTITNKLAQMFILLVNKYAQRSNWRGYTYLDEMKGQALLQLSLMSLQFDEGKGDNPFAYYTASISNSFTKVVNTEKKTQDMRDDLLINSGASPSFSRQLDYEEEFRRTRDYDHD